MSDEIVRLEGVTKVYPGAVPVTALDGVDLEIRRGEFLAIMGPSGSGKSTLLHLIGCMDKPTSGSVIIDGVDVGGLGERGLAGTRARKIGFVFQFFNLIPTLSCLENVELPMHILGRLEGGEIRARATRLLEAVGLGDRVNHRPSQLSGGERQRAAIARALANMPSLILADEPTGNLDTKTGMETIGMLREIHEATGQTVVLVTHDPRVASQAERIVRMVDGKILRGDASRHGHLSVDGGKEIESIRRELMILEVLKGAMPPESYEERLNRIRRRVEEVERGVGP